MHILASTANEILEQYDRYTLGSLEVPLSVDDMLTVIGDYTDHTIGEDGDSRKYKPIPHRPYSSIRLTGLLLRYQGRATIYAPDPDTGAVTFCEHRFIVVKEASHLVIDTPDSYIDRVAPLVQKFILDGILPRQGDSIDAQSEVVAMILALELLFPWVYRPTAHESVKSGASTYFDIADEFKIPEQIVMLALSDPYHVMAEEGYKQLQPS